MNPIARDQTEDYKYWFRVTIVIIKKIVNLFILFKKAGHLYTV